MISFKHLFFFFQRHVNKGGSSCSLGGRTGHLVIGGSLGSSPWLHGEVSLSKVVNRQSDPDELLALCMAASAISV